MYKTGIIDYGMGNLYSVRNSFKAIGIEADIIDRPKKIQSYDKLVLPGVGAFGDAMKELDSRGLVLPIKEFITSGKSFLGICLGMQLLMEKSEESPGVKGLGVIAGNVRRFSSKLKCPHMGWNKIEKTKRGLKIFKGTKPDIYAYFCHSYYVSPAQSSVSIGMTEYGVKFASVIKEGNVYGMQFHPEKSQEVGLELLRNFIKLS